MEYTTEEEAKQLLQDGEITGYMKLEEDKPKVTFQSSGINETILKQVTEEITQTTEIVSNLAETEIKKEMTAGNYHVDY